MSYERKDIPAMISLFKAVKKRIRSSRGTGYFLCHSIDEIDSPVSYQARWLVRDALEGNFTLSGWINVTHGEDSMPLSDKESRSLRVHWCDKIIRDLQEYAK